MADVATESVPRERIVSLARDWIGTPYLHQASRRGAGADCLGLIRGLYRDLYGAEPETPPAYTPDWAEATGEETLIAAAGRHLQPIALDEAAPGDVVLFRFNPSSPAKHAALLSASDRMIHAYGGRRVCESYLAPWWRRRLAAAFAFPGALPWRNSP
ncbi:MAG: NlpC/P60 family protein [Pseudomonadota bacterium]